RKHRLLVGRQGQRRGASPRHAGRHHRGVHLRHAARREQLRPATVEEQPRNFYCVLVADLIVTRAILPTPLSASHRLPLLSISMLRTVPPPPGIGNVCIFFVSGLKRTSMLCVSSPVSTYQTAPSAVMSIA